MFRCGSRRTSTRLIRTARRCTCTSVALLALAGCSGKARPVAYEDLTPKLGSLEFTRITVNRAETRSELLEVLRRNNPGRRIDVPAIDFAGKETFLVAAGPRSSTGYALRIVRVDEQAGHVNVAIRERTPSLGDPVHARVTYPYRLIVLDGHKPVHLRWLGRP